MLPPHVRPKDSVLIAAIPVFASLRIPFAVTSGLITGLWDIGGRHARSLGITAATCSFRSSVALLPHIWRYLQE